MQKRQKVTAIEFIKERLLVDKKTAKKEERKVKTIFAFFFLCVNKF